MTSIAATFPSSLRWRARSTPRDALPPLTAGLAVARAMLVAVVFLTGGLLMHILVLSGLQERAAQQRLFDRFRGQLARGTAPVGSVDGEGRPLDTGSPVAYLEIPSIGVRQVVVEGTTSGELFAGPGHRRDTPLPGQVGTSVVLGRRATFGGPFARIDDLSRGSKIRVTTGQGEYAFEVIGTRREGDAAPPSPGVDEGRLLLMTADGSPLVPGGVLRVDARLEGEASPPGRRATGSVTGPEQALGSDSSRLWALALWLEALVAAAVGAVWAWHRWGRAQAWVVFLPVLTLVSLYVSNLTLRLLPNLL